MSVIILLILIRKRCLFLYLLSCFNLLYYQSLKPLIRLFVILGTLFSLFGAFQISVGHKNNSLCVRSGVTSAFRVPLIYRNGTYLLCMVSSPQNLPPTSTSFPETSPFAIYLMVFRGFITLWK